MASIRLTADNIDSLIAAWKITPATRDTALACRASILSPDDVRTRCWDAGVLVKITPGEGDIYAVVFSEVMAESA